MSRDPHFATARTSAATAPGTGRRAWRSSGRWRITRRCWATCALKKSTKRVYLSSDEWNVWYRARSGDAVDGHRTRAPHLLEDVLVCAQYLSGFLRHADIVKIACIAQIVNVLAPLLTSPCGVLKQSIYHPFRLFFLALTLPYQAPTIPHKPGSPGRTRWRALGPSALPARSMVAPSLQA